MEGLEGKDALGGGEPSARPLALRSPQPARKEAS